jgi:very-short-patch-repair endonuclease
MDLKFYRQYPIGKYITDFCCPERKLIIEVDGGGHDHPIQRQLDAKRELYLTSLGFRIIRVWSNDVEKNLTGVIEHVQEIAYAPSPSIPLPHGEREA